jgi:hypothetical protein
VREGPTLGESWLQGFELREDGADARLDWGIVRAVAGDEFFDHRSERLGRQQCGGNSHEGMVTEKGLGRGE